MRISRASMASLLFVLSLLVVAGTLPRTAEAQQAPIISSISPNSGPTFGGTEAVINGSYFESDVEVTIGGASATVSNVVNPRGIMGQIEIVAPPGAPGYAEVVVTNPGFTPDELTDGFEYMPPTISSIVPNSGPSWGSTNVAINGSYFHAGVTVTIGGTLASVNNVVNPGGAMSQILAVTPPGAPGPADVVVINPDTYSYTLAGGFTYLGPSIASIVPDSGPSWGSTNVTINGSYFHAGVTVTIGGTEASVNIVVNPGGVMSQIEAVTPPGTPGPADVVVINPDTYGYTLAGGFTYLGPTVFSIVPDSGPSAGSTNVAINGSYFHAGVTVTIGGTAASVNNVVNPGGVMSQIEAVTPPGTPGPADVVVINPDTYSYTLAGGYRYLGPSIASIVPDSGPTFGGTPAVINGSYFVAGVEVTIGDQTAIVNSVVNPGGVMSQIEIETPSGSAGPADVTVTNPDSGTDTLVDGFTYLGPAIFSVVPDNGPTAGGTEVSINGSYFDALVEVTIGGTPAVVDNVVNPGGVMSQIVIETPSGTAGSADVTVTNPDSETDTLADGFTYVAVTPAIHSIVPDSGPTFGGRSATINGSYFDALVEVTIGGASATVSNVVNPNGVMSQIEIVTPPGTAGPADVTVTNPDSETDTLVDGFTYVVVTPAIHSIVPDSGSTFGGTSAVINGAYFGADATVTIGGAQATVLNVLNPGGAMSQIEIVTPPGTAGPADVTVTNPDSETDTLVGGFTYLVVPPAISSIAPNSGPASGGTSAAINGAYFAADATVTIGAKDVTVVNVVNPGGAMSQIEIVTPPGTPGPADVVVTNPDMQSSTLPGGFTYIPDSVYIASIVPDSGPALGGTSATINGAYFESGVTVTIGGAGATVNNVVNPGGVMSQIEIVTPPGTPGPADVVVTNPDTQSSTLPGGFTYLADPPSIFSIVPNTGPVEGGTDVTINGAYFEIDVTVTIGGASATVNNVVNPGGAICQIEAVTPPGTPGSADVVVTNPDSQSYTLPGGFTYTALPAQWTFMVYLDGDNNLEEYCIQDFLEMAQVGSSADVKVVVQMDRIPGENASYGDWTDTKRFHITQGMTPTPANAAQHLGEVNMGDPQTLIDFVLWATSSYPAEHYAVVLWNHGGGWRYRTEQESLPFKDVCVDDTSFDVLYTEELGGALDAIVQSIGTLDLVSFDACLMGMVEVAYQIREYAQVMTGSEEVEPVGGWAYDMVLGDLAQEPSMTARDLGVIIVDRYYESLPVQQVGRCTQAAIDLAEIGELADRVDTLADTLIAHWEDDESAVRNVATDVMTQIDAAVIHERHGEQWWSGSHGLAIYFPERQVQFDPRYRTTILFGQDTHWDEFLSSSYSAMHGSWVTTARVLTQVFMIPVMFSGFADHVDLYDFCEHIVNYVAPDSEYAESLVTNNFIGAGVAQGWQADDACWQYQLPFGFPFFGEAKTHVYISSNGYLDFDNSAAEYANWSLGLIENSRIAPMWSDLDTSYGDIYIHQPTPNSVCIRWDASEYGDGGSVNVEVVLHGNGTIEFNYDGGNTTLGSGWGPTIGISNGDGVNLYLSEHDGEDALTNARTDVWTPLFHLPDSDNDGLPDWIETDTGTYVDETDTGTDPNDEDSDGDDLLDGWEVNNGLDPNDNGSVDENNGSNGDPDGDTFTNEEEYFGGSDPLDIGSVPGALVWSTFIGGMGTDEPWDIALGTDGSVYVTGETYSTDFPIGAGATLLGNSDVFVFKLSADGTQREYSSYMGGSGADYGMTIMLDRSHRIWICGGTSSPDFPTTSDGDTTFGGEFDGFITELSASGSSIEHSTYVGGSGYDIVVGIAFDPLGESLYAGGYTSSADLPVTTTATYGGEHDVFVAKFGDPPYMTYLGGRGDDLVAHHIIVNELGQVALAGKTSSDDFPTTIGALDEVLDGDSDAFLTLLRADGSEPPLYSSYLGGSADEAGLDLAGDGSGNLYLVGETNSSVGFPVVGARQGTLGGDTDGFVTQFVTQRDPDDPDDPADASIVYSTYLGGVDWDSSFGVTLDSSGMAYITGQTWSEDFPKTLDAFDILIDNQSSDAFLSVLSSTGSTQVYSTYLGGDDDEYGVAVAVDPNGYVFVAGVTESNSFPITGGSFDEAYNGRWDGFVTKFDLSLLADPDTAPGGGKHEGFFDKLNPCFIATVAYGTPGADQVSTLLEFRDGCLLTNRAGRAFVRTYYRLSPPVARFIAQHPSTRKLVRATLAPVVWLARVAVHSPVAFWATCALAIALLLTAQPLLLVRLTNRRHV